MSPTLPPLFPLSSLYLPSPASLCPILPVYFLPYFSSTPFSPSFSLFPSLLSSSSLLLPISSLYSVLSLLPLNALSSLSYPSLLPLLFSLSSLHYLHPFHPCLLPVYSLFSPPVSPHRLILSLLT